jgi:hypothetical protein
LSWQPANRVRALRANAPQAMRPAVERRVMVFVAQVGLLKYG